MKRTIYNRCKLRKPAIMLPHPSTLSSGGARPPCTFLCDVPNPSTQPAAPPSHCRCCRRMSQQGLRPLDSTPIEEKKHRDTVVGAYHFGFLDECIRAWPVGDWIPLALSSSSKSAVGAKLATKSVTIRDLFRRSLKDNTEK